MSFDKYLRACLSRPKCKGFCLPCTFCIVLVVTNSGRLISMPRYTHLRCNGVLLYRVGVL